MRLLRDIIGNNRAQPLWAQLSVARTLVSVKAVSLMFDIPDTLAILRKRST